MKDRPPPRRPLIDDETLVRPQSGGRPRPQVTLIDTPTIRMEGSVGTGGMGSVHGGWDDALDRPVAVKVLHRQWLEHDDVVEKFLDEARLGAGLDHPHIVPVYSLGRRDEVGPFFTMKLVEGRTLHKLVSDLDHSALSDDDLADLVDVVIKICDALAFAHSRGVVHCDIKLSNIMVGPFGQVYLMDWGSARRLPAMPQTGDDGEPIIRGTPSVMAPEQARGDIVDERTDIFGIGALLYQALSRQAPYPKGALPYRIAMASSGKFTPLAQVAPALPRRLVAIIARAMAVDPDHRYTDLRTLKRDLQRWLRGRTDFPTLTFAPGEHLIRQGEHSDCAFILQRGRVEVRQGPAGQVIRQLGPGAVVGEAGLLVSAPRSADVVAIEQVTALRVDAAQLDEELGRVAPWLAELVHGLAERFIDRESARTSE